MHHPLGVMTKFHHFNTGMDISGLEQNELFITDIKAFGRQAHSNKERHSPDTCVLHLFPDILHYTAFHQAISLGQPLPLQVDQVLGNLCSIYKKKKKKIVSQVSE